jgi:hypothetical protein
MKKRTKIIIGTLLLLLAFGIVFSLTTPTNTEADLQRNYVYCSHIEYDKFCPPCNLAWVTYKCYLHAGDACPALPNGYCVKVGSRCACPPPMSY